MKKSLIALAVAGFAAPAFAATSNVDIYGVMNIAIEDKAVDGSWVLERAVGDELTILDNTSRIGLKGSEDLGGGLKAIWQIESALGGNGTTAIGTNASLGTRNTFVGLSGDFGTVVMGRHDTPYKLGTASLDIFGDTIGDYNLGRVGVPLLDNSQDHRNGQALAYISPTWSGFHFAVAGVMTNGESGSALSSGDNVDALSATGVYANGPLFASVSYQTVEVLDSTAWKVGVGYTFGDAKIGVIYEDVENAGGSSWGSDGDRTSWLVNGSYTMGPIVLKAQYGQVNDFNGSILHAGSTVGDTGDSEMWAIGADYNLSKRTTAYVVYADGNYDEAPAGGLNDSLDISGWNLGVKHTF